VTGTENLTHSPRRTGDYPAESPRSPRYAGAGGLEQLEIEALALDLTRPQFEIPVARVLAPGVQLESCNMIKTIVGYDCVNRRSDELYRVVALI
jgi:hypothetical protein